MHSHGVTLFSCGCKLSKTVKQKLARLQQILAMRSKWEEKAGQLERMRSWILETEHVLAGDWATNEMEGYIRGLKTRYRRISGRKNWNAYLLRYG